MAWPPPASKADTPFRRKTGSKKWKAPGKSPSFPETRGEKPPENAAKDDSGRFPKKKKPGSTSRSFALFFVKAP
jgi:hypothetical protein